MSFRLFEQGGDTTPDTSYRIASGKAGTPEVNTTFGTLVTWLESVLGFLKITNNLSDLNNKTTARTNLSVYSISDSDAALLLKADKTNVLQKDNTTAFTPTSNYHPGTKIYIDQRMSSGVGAFGNTGGASEGAAVNLTINRKRMVVITQTNANSYYKLPTTGAISGDVLTVKAKIGNTNNVAIVTANTDLSAAFALAAQDSATFIYDGTSWLIISIENL